MTPPSAPVILVLDTNTLFRGIVNASSPSGRVLEACGRRRVRLLLSNPVLDEYRDVLHDPIVQVRHPQIQSAEIDRVLNALRFVSIYIRTVTATFQYDRDPKDAMFIELAIAGDATHIISHDKDLLTLPTSRTDAGKRFRQRLPNVRIQDAASFVRDHSRLLNG